MRLTILADGISALGDDQGVAQELRVIAEGFADRVIAPADMVITTRAGVGPNGAFSQVMMTGPRAIAVEYGTGRTPALAPLRRTILGGGG